MVGKASLREQSRSGTPKTARAEGRARERAAWDGVGSC